MPDDADESTLLDQPGHLALADALGDTPETVISVHLLRRGLCRALVLSPPDRPRAAILQATADPTEPTAFGEDPVALWELLRRLEGWTCLNVALGAGPGLAALITAATARRCRLYEDVYHALGQPVARHTSPSVRRLTSDDAPLFDAATRSLGTPGWNWGGTTTMLTEGIAAGAVTDGRLVAVAHASAISDRHGDVGVATLPAWRGQGLATAAAALVCTAIQAFGRTPVWSTGVDNLPSLRVARKLGFDEVLRRVYVIPA